MTLKPLFRPIKQRGKRDCSIAVLAALLNRPGAYEEVLAQAVLVAPNVLKSGLYSSQIIEIAALLGIRLKRRRRNIDLDDMSGILEVRIKTRNHVVLLTNGLVFDPEDQGNVWDAETYVKVNEAKVVALMEEQ